MSDIVSLSLAFPTVVFSVGLGVAAAYWLLVVFGAVDAEHHGPGHVGHAHVGHAHGGHAHVGHGAIDHVSAAGSHASHADVPHGHDGLLDWLGFTGVPIMIPVTFLMLFGWAISMLANEWVPGILDDGVMGTALRAGAFVGATVVGAPLAGFATRPFRRLFKTHDAVRRHALIGRRCVVTTQTVNETFGQAEVVDHGAGLLVPVRCATPNTLVRGSSAVVFDYDPVLEVFHIASIPSPASAPHDVDAEPDPDRKLESA